MSSTSHMEAAAAAIRKWPQRLVDEGVKMADGRRYRPQPRNVSILRHVDDPPKLIEHAKSILNLPIDEFETGSKGWDAIVIQVGVELTWEWILVDPAAPWASLFTNAERQRVLDAGRRTLLQVPRGGKSTRDRVQEIADTVRPDDNGRPVLHLELRYYEPGHLFLRGYNEDGTVATAIGCRDLAEAVVLTGDAVRRARGKAMKLLRP